MPKFTYTGPVGNHYSTLPYVNDDGDTVRGLTPEQGVAYELALTPHDSDPRDADGNLLEPPQEEPGDGNWQPVDAKVAPKSPPKPPVPTGGEPDKPVDA